jgi:hypothetical protein
MPRRQKLPTLAVIPLAIALLSCQDEVVVVVPVASVEVSGPATVMVNGSVQFTALPRDDRGNLLTQRSVTWTTSNGSVASVTADGWVRGLSGGRVEVIAYCEGRTGSFDLQVTNPVPTLSSSDPSAIMAGSGSFELTVNGAGFFKGSQVLWNGQPRSTAFVSATRLQASIPQSDVAFPGTALITVSNPPPGGGVSPSISFEIITTLTGTWAGQDAVGATWTLGLIEDPITGAVSGQVDITYGGQVILGGGNVTGSRSGYDVALTISFAGYQPAYFTATLSTDGQTLSGVLNGSGYENDPLTVFKQGGSSGVGSSGVVAIPGTGSAPPATSTLKELMDRRAGIGRPTGVW